MTAGFPRLVLAAGILILAVSSEASDAVQDEFTKLQPALAIALTAAGAVELAALPPTPLIEIEARLDPAGNRITGHQRVWFPNTTGTALDTMALRLPANGACFQGASLTVTAATWNGQVLPEPESRHAGAGLVWRLPAALPPGASGCLDLDFTTTVSINGGYHGLLSRTGDSWCLYHWHPELPGRDHAGWRLPPVVPIGDQTQDVLMHVQVRLSVPSGMQVISGGSIKNRCISPVDDTVEIVAPMTRNLALVLARDLVCDEKPCGGTLVRSWHRPQVPQAGRRALALGVGSLRFFGERIGPYPYAELDVVEMIQGAEVGGMESSGLVLIDTTLYDKCESMPEECGSEIMPIFMLTLVVAHEVAHQWWYTIIGSDSFNDPWLDESITNWAGGWYGECVLNRAAGAGALSLCYMTVMTRPEGLKKAADLPLDGYQDMTEYGVVVYGRGALMYQALRRAVGEDRFAAFLHDYHDRNRFRVATPAAWKACVERVLGPQQTKVFMDTWLSAKGMTASKAIQASLLPLPLPPVAP